MGDEKDSQPGAIHQRTRSDNQLLVLVKLIAAILLVASLYFAKGLLIPVFVAILVWLTFGPAVRWLSKRNVPAILSSLLIVLSLGLFLAGAMYTASGPLARWIDDFPRVSAQVHRKLLQVIEPVEEMNNAADAITSVGDGINGERVQKVVVQGPGLVFKVAENMQYVVTTLGATMVLLFFLLASGGHFHNRLIESFDSLSDKKAVLKLLQEIEGDVSQYLLSVLCINVLLGVVVAASLWFAGMPDAMSWGVTAALLNFMPYIGPIFGALMLLVASIIEFEQLGHILMMPAIYVALTSIEGQFVTPHVLGNRFDISPVVLLISVAFWAWIWGIVGALIAVPVLVVVKVISDRTGFLPLLSQFASTKPRER